MKYLLGEASAWEQQAVQKWLADDPANKQYFDHFKLIWDTSRQLALASTVDENKAWQRFKNRVSNDNAHPAPVRTIRFPWIRVAAASVIVMMVSLITYMLVINGSPREMIAQSTDNVLKQTLPDGSIATLNKKSSLTYPFKFKGDTRAVTLKGEAFFNVTPDKEKPFIIQANDVVITVVGTSFNVKTEGARTEVVVETGIVRVTKEGKTIELKPGERTIVSAESGPPTKEEVTDKLYNYYRTREFVCDDTPLWKLVEVVNEAYNVNIIIGRAGLRNEMINTTFNNESLDQVLDVISQTLNTTVERKDDQIILK